MVFWASGLTSASKNKHLSFSPQVRHRRGNRPSVDTLCEAGGNMFTEHRNQHASHIMVENYMRVGEIMNKGLLRRHGWFYLYKCLCCAESFVLRKYLCGGSRAAKVGQGRGSIIDLPLLHTAYRGWPTINTDLYSHEPCGSQSMLNNRCFIFSLYRIQQDL